MAEFDVNENQIPIIDKTNINCLISSKMARRIPGSQEIPHR